MQTWNMTPEGHATTMLTLQCTADGTVHMETPGQNGFRGDFNTPQEAVQSFLELCEQGIAQGNISS